MTSQIANIRNLADPCPARSASSRRNCAHWGWRTSYSSLASTLGHPPGWQSYWACRVTSWLRCSRNKRQRSLFAAARIEVSPRSIEVVVRAAGTRGCVLGKIPLGTVIAARDENRQILSRCFPSAASARSPMYGKSQARGARSACVTWNGCQATHQGQTEKNASTMGRYPV